MAKNKILFANLGNSPKDKVINVVLIIVIIIALYFGGRFLYNKIKILFSAEAQELRNEVNTGGKLSYAKSEYNNMAESLHYAMKGLGTDTDTVYSVFYRMNTKADVLQLIVAFGVKGGENLSQWLKGETRVNISKINSILSSKNIEYAF